MLVHSYGPGDGVSSDAHITYPKLPFKRLPAQLHAWICHGLSKKESQKWEQASFVSLSCCFPFAVGGGFVFLINNVR